MRKTTLALSLGYYFSAYSLGLLVHPYKTVRELVRMKVFTPLVITPAFFWVLWYLVGLVVVWAGRLMMWLWGWTSVSFDLLLGLAFLFWWGTFFLLLWQAVVGYLWWRFKQIVIE